MAYFISKEAAERHYKESLAALVVIARQIQEGFNGKDSEGM